MTKHGMAALLFAVVFAAGCKGEKKTDTQTPPATEPATEAAAEPDKEKPAAEPDKEKPALPSIGDDPSPTKICARLAAAAAAEGGEGEARWKELAPECEKNLAEAMSSRVEKYSAFAECMRDKETFTAVMNDCQQLER